VTHWRRPGKEGRGGSATTNYADSDLLYVFSSNEQPSQDGHAYGKFAAKALRHHGYGWQLTQGAMYRRPDGAMVYRPHADA
jgi:hypothetical protein